MAQFAGVFSLHLKAHPERELKASTGAGVVWSLNCSSRNGTPGGELNMVKKEQNQEATATSERRAEPRVKTSQGVLVRTPNARPIEACMLDASSRGVRLRAPEPVPVGAAVRVDGREAVLFGTVTRCEPTRGAFDVGISLSRPWEMLSELRKFNAALLVESEPL
jgi:hypothetical protein